MSDLAGRQFGDARDGENNPIRFAAGYALRRDLPAMLRAIEKRHGAQCRLLPMSGASAGGGIFQASDSSAGDIVALKFEAPAAPRVRMGATAGLDQVELDEIVIDADAMEVSAGAAITLGQLGDALADRLGAEFRVPGADLTSFEYAATGATFMTGGMGPQRRYVSDSVTEIALHDGSGLRSVRGDALGGYAGTYGWTGLVAALRCRFYRFPPNEISFALPVSDRPGELARLLAHLAPYCELDLDASGGVVSARGNHAVLGLEHVSRASMQPLLNASGTGDSRRHALELQRKCEAAGAAGLVFVSALSHDLVDEFVTDLLDDPEAGELTIAGIALEHAEVFPRAAIMRDVREAIPYAARMQAPAGRRVYKNHTDATVRLAGERVESAMTRLWQINRDYVAAVESYYAGQDSVRGEILVYGHLNPHGVDPHNRVTMSSDDDDAFGACREFLLQQRAEYYRALCALCDESGVEFVGGEKAADSERGIYQALGGPDRAPPALRARFEAQRARVRAASPRFNWRALAPYR